MRVSHDVRLLLAQQAPPVQVSSGGEEEGEWEGGGGGGGGDRGVVCVPLTRWLCHDPAACLLPHSLGSKLNTPSHSFERTSSVRISGRRGNKPTDPVEEYRANYRTEALEAHPPIPINGFVNKLLVMRTNDNQLFLEEFGSIEMTPQQPCSVAELPANRSKNRYNNILTYDHSRVKLSHGRGQSDYINASHCSVRGGGGEGMEEVVRGERREGGGGEGREEVVAMRWIISYMCTQHVSQTTFSLFCSC